MAASNEHSARAEVPPTKLISERIQVETSAPEEGVREPIAFTWRGQRHAIRTIVNAWVDTGFATGETTRTWYNRRHRNYYRVEADDGQRYEFYLDRSGNRREWVLARQL
ncbi:MAG: DUF6504 family protein [Armatimonadota bacterium]